MTVKNVIASALTLLGRADVASALEGKYWQEWQELIDTLVYCFNAVEDELARKYIPLSTEEVKTSKDFKYYYSDFNCRPVKIKRVKADGKYILSIIHI